MSQTHVLNFILLERRIFFRELIASYIEHCAPDIHLHQATSLEETETLLGHEDQADLLIWSFVESERDILQGISRLASCSATVPIAVISESEDPEFILSLCQAGVQGYFPVTLKLVAALHALRSVAAGGIVVPSLSLAALPKSPGIARGSSGGPLTKRSPEERAKFTARQREVLERLRQGKSNKTIASELCVQESTVKVHVSSLMRKLKAQNRTQVVTAAQDLPSSATGLDR